MGLNIKKTHNPNKKWMQGLNRSLFKEDIQMAKKVMNRCSTSLITTEIQINTTRYYLLPAIVKNLQTIHTGEGVKKMKSSYTVDGNVN